MSTQPLVHLVTTDEVKGQAKKIFEQIKEKTGGVPKWMRVMANCDDVFVGFFTLFKATMDDAPVDSQLKWKVAYYVSELNKCEFCVSVSKMQLKTFGLKDEEMNDLAATYTEREKLAIEYAEAATEHAYNINPEVMKRVQAVFNDQELVELTSVIGLFNFINRFNDSLGVLPDVD